MGQPWAVWVGGDTEDVHEASFQLDHEQHAVAAEQDSVDMEERCREDAWQHLSSASIPSGLSGSTRCSQSRSKVA